MPLYVQIVNLSWLVFLAYWGISSLYAKKTIHTAQWGHNLPWRIAIGSTVFVIFSMEQGLSAQYPFLTISNVWLNDIGALLCVVGVAFAVWARTYLGRNWGMPMSSKENPELITSGPYAFVRHPIYSGILLAYIGTTLAINLLWIIAFIVFGVYFAYSAHVEEKSMYKEFPHEYPKYKRTTKSLVPFIF